MKRKIYARMVLIAVLSVCLTVMFTIAIFYRKFEEQIIDDLKESMPAELEQAKKVLAEKDKIISDAQHHAESMVAQAKDYIAKLTEESELVRQAQEHANQIIQNANDSSEQLKNSSITYAGDVLKYVESTLEKTLSSIQQNRESLLKNNGHQDDKPDQQ